MEGPIYWGPSTNALNIKELVLMAEVPVMDDPDWNFLMDLYIPPGFDRPFSLGKKGFLPKMPRHFDYAGVAVASMPSQDQTWEKAGLYKAASYLYSMAGIAYGIKTGDPFVVYDIATLGISIFREF